MPPSGEDKHIVSFCEMKRPSTDDSGYSSVLLWSKFGWQGLCQDRDAKTPAHDMTCAGAYQPPEKTGKITA